MIDARKFWTMCRLHDWFYMMSEDPGAYQSGKEYEDMLLGMAHKDPALADIYTAWREHHFDCGPVPKEPMLED